MTAAWVDKYYDAIFVCVARYREMAETARMVVHTSEGSSPAHNMDDVLAFLDEFTREVPLVKLSRWLGYVQGVLIERGKTTVAAERDITRSLFRPLDFPARDG